MYIKIQDLINKNNIKEALILLNNITKLSIEDDNISNDNIKLLFLLIKCHIINNDVENIKKNFLLLEKIVEKKIFLDNSLYETKDIEDLINLYINFLYHFLEEKNDNTDLDFYLNYIFDFLSNLYCYDEFNIENKIHYILESWTQFNSFNLKKHFNIKNYFNNTTKLLKLIGMYDFIFVNNDNNLLNNFYENYLYVFNENVLIILSKILHNYSNTFIELENKNIDKILYFNLKLSNLIIEKNINFGKFIFFFLISNINYRKYSVNKIDFDVLKNYINDVLYQKLSLNSESNKNYEIFYDKIIFLKKTNVDKKIIDDLFDNFIQTTN